MRLYNWGTNYVQGKKGENKTSSKLFFYISSLLFGDYLVSVVMTYVRDWYSH